MCDVVLAADTARFACSFGKVGLVPDTGVSEVLVHRLGHAVAFDLDATGRTIGAEEARALGLVTAVVPADELGTAVRQRADALAAGPATSLALTKRLFRLAAKASTSEILAAEATAQGRAAASAYHAEGLAAFTEKRAPKFVPSS